MLMILEVLHRRINNYRSHIDRICMNLENLFLNIWNINFTLHWTTNRHEKAVKRSISSKMVLFLDF